MKHCIFCNTQVRLLKVALKRLTEQIFKTVILKIEFSFNLSAALKYIFVYLKKHFQWKKLLFINEVKIPLNSGIAQTKVNKMCQFLEKKNKILRLIFLCIRVKELERDKEREREREREKETERESVSVSVR